MSVGRSHAADAAADGELDECVVTGGVERIAVVPQLDKDAISPERLEQAVELPPGRGRPIGDECGGDGALAATGEHPRVTGHDSGDIVHGELRRTLLPGEVPETDRPGQLGVPRRSVGEEQEVLPGGIRSRGVGHLPRVHLGERLLLAAESAVADKGELGAEDRWHPHLTRRLGETDDPVEAVVIGEGERFEAETRCLGDELLGV